VKREAPSLDARAALRLDNRSVTGLFQPFSRWTYYVCAATAYDGIDGPVLTGYCVSALGRDCDEFGDQGLPEIAALRVHGLPPERDLHFEPMPVSSVCAHVARRGYGP
jgi:hypothetical protein